MPEWSRIANTTIHKYVREVEDAMMRNRKLMALLREKGRITYGNSGDMVDWKIKYRRMPTSGYLEGDTLTFTRQDRWKTAQLGWRGVAGTDAMYKMEKLKNRNMEAIVKVWEQMAESMLEDIEEDFGNYAYIDGNASGNTKKPHGIESFMGTSGANASAPIGTPSDSYAGLNTDLGSYGGSWTGSWPTGTGSSEYDFWSPLIVNYTSTVATASGGWQATTKTWANTCREALRYGIIKARRNRSSKKYMLDLILLNDELYRLFKDKHDSQEKIVATPTPGSLLALGFPDVMNFEGCDVSYEYGVPANVGYGWCLQCMELASMQDELFVVEGPFYNETDQSHRLSIDFFGNFLYKQLRHFLKLIALG